MLSSRSSSRSGGRGHDRLAAEARHSVSVTVVLPIPQVAAMEFRDCPKPGQGVVSLVSFAWQLDSAASWPSSMKMRVTIRC